ncbi:DNA-directed RNA polymerase subunit beta' [Candidatus Berkelbacteria bacterium CG10_big_fil_rev_8_21_14_0_10_43_13]|uniref:DNA-directed RNA polymerase subunit beta' n=1 Tax=Candidatus Berkelbacteria bacterium CG10_big_fil_rev_8_21_14_0_10_43_13 TaxID=1974514 RepID=A0A2H0W6Q5_9BACT|nr:MAG: DNA-directed RNA polymerase subunit beta' [Candidatus Berkelbacteria bacterium CG10_big_fil_rev_8_21_14_0_10_43_13]
MPSIEVKDQVAVSDFEAIRLSIASPEDILSWSHGEVIKPETINYRTQKPERDGLFCERIFGPTKDWECYCGKYKKIRYKGVICDKCGVEVTRSSVRRVRMGHIDLAVPTAHIWYVRGTSSICAAILSLSGADIEKVVYFASYVILDINEELRQSSLENLETEYKEYQETIKKGDETPGATSEEIEQIYKETKSELGSLSVGKIISEQSYRDLNMKYGQIVRVGIGAEAILELLKNYNIKENIEIAKTEARKLAGLARAKVLKKLRVLQSMNNAGINPAWLVLNRVPVIPPDLRPMVQLDGGRFAASDLNDLYRRVINRNNRLKRLLSQGAPEVICRNEKRMLQEAVDALIDNSARKDKAASSTGGKRKLKSLSDMLRGKQGRFRQNLLGKRVDYSGRSVIVVGPKLKLFQCGLPKVMALELFKPFVIGRLIADGYVHNVKNATRLIEKGESFVWDILEDVIKDKCVLLNRAPTLHRLGIQAFKPILIEGKAIKVHPLVCSAFNADFDGDQMAVHLPLSDLAQEEAHEIMLSSKNLLKPSSGDPVLTLSFDIVLGCHYLTRDGIDGLAGNGSVFSSKNAAISAFELNGIDINSKIKVRMPDGNILDTSPGRLIFNEVLPEGWPYVNEVMTKKTIGKLTEKVYHACGAEITATLVDDIKELGFVYAQKSGMTFAVDDIYIPETKDKILEKAQGEVDSITKLFERGLISDEERYNKTIEIWMGAQSQMEKDMMAGYPTQNDIYIIMNSGARGNIAQMTQVGAMKGMVADPTGAIIELPIRSNFKEGLSVFEYFVSTHGSRKGRADTALRTSEAGYLTRRLVDVSQDVVTSCPDCGTSNTRRISKSFYAEFGEEWDKYIRGRTLGKTAAGVKKGTTITEADIAKFDEVGLTEIEIFSLLGCEAKKGICQKCYGIDLATGRTIEIGTAVGIVAAQAIGEPGTQLTMRTFHTGGAAGADITTGLPRVEQLFEARMPKSPAVLSEVAGKVTITKASDIVKITVSGQGEKVEDYELPSGYKTVVENDAAVVKNQTIAESESGDGKPVRTLISGKFNVSGNKIKVAGVGDAIVEYAIAKTTSLLVKDGDVVEKGQPLTEGHFDLGASFKLNGAIKTQNYIIKQVQIIYDSQGQDINDKHIEVIVRMMSSKVKVVEAGDSKYLPGQVVSKIDVAHRNRELAEQGKKQIKSDDMIMGITRVALKTDSFLSAASFQETTSILIDAAISGKIDNLKGLKENVIIGKLIPAGTGFDPVNDTVDCPVPIEVEEQL